MIVDHPQQRGRINHKQLFFQVLATDSLSGTLSDAHFLKKKVFWSIWGKKKVHMRLIENSRTLSTRKGNSVSSSQSSVDGIYLLKPKCN